MLKTRTGLLGAIGALLVVFAAADLFVAHHPAFGIDGIPAFAAGYGIAAAAAAIGLARAWGRIARRGETAAEQEGRDD